MQALDYDSGSIDIDAPPQVVFTLITDIHQMARFSPELVSCRWLDGADRAALGARFEAVNQVPGHRPWKNRPVVTVYEPHQRFAISRTELFAGTLVWAYDLDSDGNKTVLTESYQVTKPVSRIGWMIIEKGFGGHDRQGVLRRGIHDTLDAIKAAAESTRKPVVEHRNMRSR
jgi:Polyketide cyclase / dehydrase and lipid transport